MTLHLRRGMPEDAAGLGDICYRAFKDIAEAHGFLPDFPSAAMAAGMTAGMMANPWVFDIVAESDGRLMGSNYLYEGNSISGVGPITVDPLVQNGGAGALLMQAVMERSARQGFAGVRLVQSGYHSRSLALYLKLGFDAREQLACLQGPAIGKVPEGRIVRAATAGDIEACNRLCLKVHGHERRGELADAVQKGSGRVVEREGQVTGYSTLIAFFGHAVGETTADIAALIGAADTFYGPGILIPTRNSDLMRWCLANGLRITQTLTLMSMGFYNEPDGAWLPSVMY